MHSQMGTGNSFIDNSYMDNNHIDNKEKVYLFGLPQTQNNNNILKTELDRIEQNGVPQTYTNYQK